MKYLLKRQRPGAWHTSTLIHAVSRCFSTVRIKASFCCVTLLAHVICACCCMQYNLFQSQLAFFFFRIIYLRFWVYFNERIITNQQDHELIWADCYVTDGYLNLPHDPCLQQHSCHIIKASERFTRSTSKSFLMKTCSSNSNTGNKMC